MTDKKNSPRSAVYCLKKLFPLVLLLLLPVFPVFAQEGEEEKPELDTEISETDTASDTDTTSYEAKGDFWFCPGAEIALYSSISASYGGSLAIGYGRGSAIGIKAAYLVDRENNGTLEISVLLRFYFLGKDYYQGPFLQLSGGPVLFFSDNQLDFPADVGSFSAGLSLGWRFLLGKWWFVEPSIRTGYPYLFGAGLSFGFHH